MLKKSIYGFVFLTLAVLAGYAGGRMGQNKVDNVFVPSQHLHYIPTNHIERNGNIDDVSANLQNYPLSFVKASEISTPAVVYIKTASNAPQRSFNDWFFGDIFGGRQDVVINSGSGVIVSGDGYIVTNNHVVEKAVKIEVILTNKQSYDAILVGTDPSSDLALLKIGAKGLKTINFANSNGLKVGEWVLAVGNPFNLTSTVTAGIVSAKGRNLNLLSNIFPIESFIQTDAAINPGNSGGALVNLNGDLVGINTAILSRTGAYNGYGFAVPSNIVQKIIRDLKEYGAVQRAFLGADVTDIDARIQERAMLKSMNGVYVNNVAGYGPAKEAGIKEGDVILEFNQIPVNSKAEFDEQLSYYRPGERVSITIARERSNQSLNIKLTNTEGTLDILKSEAIIAQKLGASFESIGKLERDRLNIKGGVRISNITNGYIRRMGLREGFIITHINKIEIVSPAQCIDILENLNGQISIEGIDTNGRKAYYTFYSY
jgi:serine protease Do